MCNKYNAFFFIVLHSISVQCEYDMCNILEACNWDGDGVGGGAGGARALSRPGELGDCESANWKCTALEREGEGGEGGGGEERKRRY